MSFFFMAEKYSVLYTLYCTVHMHTHPPFYLAVDGHLVCFHVLAVVSSAAVNIEVHVCIFLNYSFVQVYAQGWDCLIIW